MSDFVEEAISDLIVDDIWDEKAGRQARSTVALFEMLIGKKPFATYTQADFAAFKRKTRCLPERYYQFCIFLDYAAPGVSGLNTQRFERVLGMVQASYLDLFAFRDRYAPGVPIIGHSYDFPVPDRRHPACAGPWLKPSLQYCNWPVAQGTEIVKQALVLFRQMLADLANSTANNFRLAETQGLLKPTDWANELHPYPPGFATFAKAFADKF